jgi:hypothetical protein
LGLEGDFDCFRSELINWFCCFFYFHFIVGLSKH